MVSQSHGPRRALVEPAVELAERQYGVVAIWQLRELGLERPVAQTWTRNGRLRSLHRGVYAVGHVERTQEAAWIAAVLAYGPRALLSHGSGCALFGLRAAGAGGPIDVTVPGTTGCSRRPGIRVHASGRDARELAAEHRGIPVTAVARSIADFAAAASRRQLERVIDASQRLRLASPAELRRTAEALAGHHGAGRLLRLLREHEVGSTFTRSELEEMLMATCIRHALPAPAVNAVVGRYEVDFLWERERLVVEADGFAAHGTLQAFERDRLRDARRLTAGYRVLRVTYRQVAREPAVVASLIRSALRSP